MKCTKDRVQKTRDVYRKEIIHWNVATYRLPGSSMIVLYVDRVPNGCSHISIRNLARQVFLASLINRLSARLNDVVVN